MLERAIGSFRKKLQQCVRFIGLNLKDVVFKNIKVSLICTLLFFHFFMAYKKLYFSNKNKLSYLFII